MDPIAPMKPMAEMSCVWLWEAACVATMGQVAIAELAIAFERLSTDWPYYEEADIWSDPECVPSDPLVVRVGLFEFHVIPESDVSDPRLFSLRPGNMNLRRHYREGRKRAEAQGIRLDLYVTRVECQTAGIQLRELLERAEVTSTVLSQVLFGVLEISMT